MAWVIRGDPVEANGHAEDSDGKTGNAPRVLSLDLATVTAPGLGHASVGVTLSIYSMH